MSVIRSQACSIPVPQFQRAQHGQAESVGAHTRASYAQQSCATLSRASMRAPWKSPVLKHLLTLLSSSGRLSVSAMAPEGDAREVRLLLCAALWRGPWKGMSEAKDSGL